MKSRLTALFFGLCTLCSLSADESNYDFLPKDWALVKNSDAFESVDDPQHSFRIFESSAAIDRVGFFRYSGKMRGKLLSHHIDTLIESAYDGNYHETQEEKGERTNYPLQTSGDISASHGSLYFVNLSVSGHKENSNWLAFGLIWAEGVDDDVYALVFASKRIHSPEKCDEWRSLLKKHLKEIFLSE